MVFSPGYLLFLAVNLKIRKFRRAYRKTLINSSVLGFKQFFFLNKISKLYEYKAIFEQLFSHFAFHDQS